MDPKLAFSLSWFLLLALLERVFPFRRTAHQTGNTNEVPTKAKQVQNGRDSFARLFRNFGLAGINGVLSVLVVIPLTLWASGEVTLPAITLFGVVPLDMITGFIASIQAFNSQWRADQGLYWLVVDLIILDFWIYWWHRANHTIPFLMRFHQVHHLDRHLDTTTALRFHFGEVFLSALVRCLVIIAFSIPFFHIVVFETLVLILPIFHHANIRLPTKIDHMLSKVIVTPSWHFVHHHAVRADTDSHYGVTLTLWDRLFKSHHHQRRTPDMVIGLEGYRRDLSFRRLVSIPFSRIPLSSPPTSKE